MTAAARIRLAATCSAFITSLAIADDWPQWRGPHRDGVWRETGIIKKFPASELKPLWTSPCGAGYSGPTVAGDRVFLTDRITDGGEQERVLCFDRTTGGRLWAFAYPCAYRVDYPLGPRAAVSVAGESAVALGAMGHLHCLAAGDGKLRWSHDLAAEFGADVPVWGISSSPLIAGDLVIVQCGGRQDACLIAFDLATGKERWRALDGRASYSSPRPIKIGNGDAVLAWTGNWLAALDPASGKVFWSQPYKPSKMVINVADPVLDELGARIFLSAFYDGSFLFKHDIAAPQISLLWKRQGVSERKTDALHCMIMTPLIRGGHVYGLDSYGEFRCLDLATGDRVWTDDSLLENGRWATAFFVQNGDRTWITTETGEIIIAKLSPQGFERISTARCMTPTTVLRPRRHPITWSHPAYAHRCLFARTDTELLCISLAAAP